MKKIPKGVTVYRHGRKYVGEVPDELAHVVPIVDEKVNEKKPDKNGKSSSTSGK